MPWSSVNLPLAERTRRAADKPLFITQNALRFNNRQARWCDNGLVWTNADSGEADNASLAIAPEFYGYDGKGNRLTFPVGSAINTFAYLFDLDEEHDIDAVAILGHNFADLPGTITVGLYIADNEAFSSNLAGIASWVLSGSGKTSRRLVDLELGSAPGNRYSGVRYGGLLIQTDSTFSASEPPRIGELFLGRTRALARQPDRPGDVYRRVSDVGWIGSDDGDASGYSRAVGRRELDLTWTSDENDALGDDLATWDEIFEDTEDGTQPFVFIPHPTTDPTDALLMHFPEPALQREWLGPYHANIRQMLHERPPFRRSEP